jgi:hypothetical protein
MSADESKSVECGTHGRADAAFVCRHLAGARTGPPLGFHQAYIDPENRQWGDLNGWCDRCDTIYAAEGEWNDTSEAFAGVTMICSGCFFDLKARHERPARGS